MLKGGVIFKSYKIQLILLVRHIFIQNNLIRFIASPPKSAQVGELNIAFIGVLIVIKNLSLKICPRLNSYDSLRDSDTKFHQNLIIGDIFKVRYSENHKSSCQGHRKSYKFAVRTPNVQSNFTSQVLTFIFIIV